MVPGRLPPLVIPGLRAPRMLLPMDLLDRLDTPQRAALLLHELVHIKRGDHLVRMLEFAVRVAFWWLPLVGLIGRQLRACEETCCDAAVVAQLPESRRDYAALLLDVIDFATPEGRVAVQATAMGAANDLEQRLARFSAPPRERDALRLAQAVAVGLACAILPCGLHYDFGGRPTPAATSVGNEPAAGAAPSPGSDREDQLSKNVCCPS